MEKAQWIIILFYAHEWQQKKLKTFWYKRVINHKIILLKMIIRRRKGSFVLNNISISFGFCLCGRRLHAALTRAVFVRRFEAELAENLFGKMSRSFSSHKALDTRGGDSNTSTCTPSIFDHIFQTLSSRLTVEKRKVISTAIIPKESAKKDFYLNFCAQRDFRHEQWEKL